MPSDKRQWLMYAFAAFFGLALAAIIIMVLESKKPNPTTRNKTSIGIALALFGVAFFMSILMFIGYYAAEEA